MNPMMFLELMVSLCVQTFVIVLATHFLSRATDDDRVQCRLWAACFWGMLIVVVFAVLLPHFRWSQVRPDFGRQTAASIMLWEMKIGELALLVWGIGAVIALFINVVHWCRIRIFLRSCKAVDEPLLQQIRDSQAGGDGIDLGRTRLLTSPMLSSPFCMQFHRPYIVLPTYLLCFEPQELSQIVRHEMEHIRTGHPLQLFIQRIVELLFWFHPMVWWASHQSELHREFVCDRAATKSPDRIVSYLKTLLRVVKHTTEAGPSHPLSFGRRKSNIARRAERLVARAQGRQRSPSHAWNPRCLALALTGILVVVSQVWAPLNLLASSRSHWSPWPHVTAQVLHDFGVPVRDYEAYHHNMQLHEILETEEVDD